MAQYGMFPIHSFHISYSSRHQYIALRGAQIQNICSTEEGSKCKDPQEPSNTLLSKFLAELLFETLERWYPCPSGRHPERHEYVWRPLHSEKTIP